MDQEWISLNEFMRRNKMGYESAMRLIKNGKVDYEKSETGQYKIKVTKNAKIDEFVENLIRENEELRTYIKTIQNVTKQIQV